MGENVIVPILGVICVIGLPVATVGIVLMMLIKSKHEERMEMIKQGLTPKESEKPANRFPALRNGLVLIGFALGILLGMLISQYIPERELLIIPTFAFMCGGIGFVVYYWWSERLIKAEMKNKNEDDL